MSALEVDDIQGIIISGYGHLHFSRYLFFKITNLVQARAWLESLIPQITTANWSKGTPPSAVNIAFTSLGLKTLELPLSTFSEEFVEGMAEPRRSKHLQDQGKTAPSQWSYQHRMGLQDCFCSGVSENCSCQKLPECHFLLILQTRLAIERQKKTEVLMESIAGIEKLFHEDGYISYFKKGDPLNYKDHFGFRDSISQPDIEGSPALSKKLLNQPYLQQDVIKAGEFILGYLNEDNHLPKTPYVAAASDKNDQLKSVANHPEKRDLGRNGSYLVFRKLEQDVPEFHNYVARLSLDKAEQKKIAAKLIGRWQSGAPLSLNAESDPGEYRNQPHSAEDYEPENRFHFRPTDPDGLRCPLGAHIRRANPRDSLGKDSQSSIARTRHHRILRRGALYGDLLAADQENEGDCGVLFMCINTSIKGQFEFIQTMWLNNPRFSHLEGETDPIVGHSAQGGSYTLPSKDEDQRKFTIQQQPVRQKLQNLPDFVTLRGGGYFFLPSISALHFLVTVDSCNLGLNEDGLNGDKNQSADAPRASNESC